MRGNFALYADWRLDNDVEDEAVTAGANAIEIDDPDAWVWRDDQDCRVIHFSFDVRASDLHDAGDWAKRCLAHLPCAGLPGKIIRLEACTETHIAKWEANDL